MRLPHQPQYAAEYAYLAATYRPDPEDARIAQLVEESERAERESELEWQRQQWRLVQNSTGRVIRTFDTEDDAIFYQQWDSLYPVSEYTICGPETNVQLAEVI